MGAQGIRLPDRAFWDRYLTLIQAAGIKPDQGALISQSRIILEVLPLPFLSPLTHCHLTPSKNQRNSNKIRPVRDLHSNNCRWWHVKKCRNSMSAAKRFA